MKYQVHYGSHIPVLLKVFECSENDVYEFGMGINSSPLLHWLCFNKNRRLYSYETNPKYYDFYKQYETNWHNVFFVKDWNDLLTGNGLAGMVFIDCHPREVRKDIAMIFEDEAHYIILHDSCGRDDKKYRYSEIYPYFKYLYTYSKIRPHTTIVSNFIDLKGFTV